MKKTVILLSILALILGSCKPKTNSNNPSATLPQADSVVEKVLDLVADQKKVKDQMQLIDSLSKGTRHISLIPFLDDSEKNIYLVKVCEDNGASFVTYFNFLVDANDMTIIKEIVEEQEQITNDKCVVEGVAGVYEIEDNGLKIIYDKKNLTSNDSIYTLSIRPNEKLQVGKVYTDSFEYLDYNNETDNVKLIVKKDGKIYTFVADELYGDIVELNKGDLLEIQWNIDFLTPAGDETIYFVVTFAEKITKINTK